MVLLKWISNEKIGIIPRKQPTEEYAQENQSSPEVLQENDEEITSDRMQIEGERQSSTNHHERKEHDTSLEKKSMFATNKARNREMTINPVQSSQSEEEDSIVFEEELDQLDAEHEEVYSGKLSLKANNQELATSRNTKNKKNTNK